MSSTTLHLMHCSLHAQGTTAGNRQDIRYAIKEIGADIISFTEMKGFHDELREIARSNGYTPVFYPNNVGEAFALRNDAVKLKDRGNVLAHDAGPGRQFARFINWVEVKFGEELVYYHTGHWLAHLDKGQGRVMRHNEMTQQMAAQVRKHAQGESISFFSGDTNVDDQNASQTNYDEVYRNNGLLSIWDEFKVHPNTFGNRTIDVIGSYNRDGRVSGKRYKVHPRQNSDHRFVSAWYEIKARKRTNPGGNPGGGTGGGGEGGGGAGGGDPTSPDPAQDDFYATGGNINWSDYFDGAIYHLPQAVDDSDGPTHGDTISD